MNKYDKAPSGVNTSQWQYPVSGVFDKEADAMRQKIWNSPDALDVKGNKWYVSENGNDENDGRTPETAWATIDAMNAHKEEFGEGDAVLFERGGVYRGRFVAKPYVSYGAYGTGDKPCIYGSPYNLATVEWEKTDRENVWKYGGYDSDVGIVIFEHGKLLGRKKCFSAGDLRIDYDFYYDKETGVLYMYREGVSPAEGYTSIEAGQQRTLLDLPGGTEGHVVIDNLCLKYTGGHAIGGGTLKNCTVQNCEIGWIGGSMLGNSGARYGNGFENWGPCDGLSITNTWIYQCYDTGFTFQGTGEGPEKNIVFSNNLVEYCWYSTEMWNNGPNGGIENVTMDGNMLRFAGYGWGKERYDPVNASHMFNMARQAKNFVVTNTIFEGSTQALFLPYGAQYDGNTYVQHRNNNYGSLGCDRDGNRLAFDANAEANIRDKIGDKNATVIYAEV